ncbi:Protein of unknown function [Microlunatus flavus]|uniref:DUF2891 domain-containing protein n=1 Tax=Microlunatus flavus TaxID=1036181 RepID=A0A1H9I943_9ACTN|nr:Protein of unknown function [Microlunatus flavus]
MVNGPEDVQQPRERHPAFHGCYDWHSAVHTHWLLVRLLHEHAGPASTVDGEAVAAVLDDHLTPANLAAEAAVLRREPSFERPYGWAWLAMLGAACTAAAADGVPGAQAWADAVRPAADVVADLVLAWLPQAGRPVRDGTHASTAFALALLLDAARPLGRDDLAAAVRAYVEEWFVPDADAPLRWEPSGHDFLSPGLAEADLVRRVLPAGGFGAWLSAFWPGLDAAQPQTLLEPVAVPDRTDGQVGHLDGLNLSRAAALAHLADALPADDARRPVLTRSAGRHREAGFAALAETGFMSTHWLGSFALLALDAGR